MPCHDVWAAPEVDVGSFQMDAVFLISSIVLLIDEGGDIRRTFTSWIDVFLAFACWRILGWTTSCRTPALTRFSS
jgi:hypothetical protein